MSGNKTIVATLAGGFTAFFLGFLIYGVALADFFATNVGSATGVMRDPPNLGAIALGQFPIALLLALAIPKWGGDVSMASGAKVGALFSFLIALGFDLTVYGSTNISNLTATLVDPIISVVFGAVIGAVIGMVLGRGAKTA